MTGAIRIGSTSLRSVFNCVKYFVRTLHVLTVAHQPEDKRKPSLPRNGVVIGGENLRSCNGEHMKYVNGAFTLVNAKRNKEPVFPS